MFRMRKIKLIFFCFLGLLTIFCSSVSQAKVQLPTIELTPGLRYEKMTTSEQQTLHVLEIDPNQFRIIAAHADDKVIGRETLESMAKRYKAVAGINGGFFKMGTNAEGLSIEGLPAGILRIQGKWYGVAYRSRGAIGWSKHPSTPLIDRVQTKTTVLLNQQKFPVHGINQPGSAFNVTLYTDAYGKVAETLPGSFDIILQNDKIIGINQTGQTPIPQNGYVYSFGQNVKTPIPTVKKGQLGSVTIEVLPEIHKQEHYPAWQSAENIVGGTPLLMSKGNVLQIKQKGSKPSPFINERYARTAVGLLKNGHWIFVVVERNALNTSQGMTIPELANTLKDLGCEHALNLDGGGSSTLYVNDRVINHPEGDEDESPGVSSVREVSDAILVLPRA